jgi:predicted RNA binding protein YcfA (HicA-like mRNA interferase family)
MKSYSGKRFCKILEQHGWILVRINGSHHIYRKQGEQFAISVPVHKNEDLKQGILTSMLKKANLTEDDLL